MTVRIFYIYGTGRDASLVRTESGGSSSDCLNQCAFSVFCPCIFLRHRCARGDHVSVCIVALRGWCQKMTWCEFRQSASAGLTIPIELKRACESSFGVRLKHRLPFFCTTDSEWICVLRFVPFTFFASVTCARGHRDPRSRQSGRKCAVETQIKRSQGLPSTQTFDDERCCWCFIGNIRTADSIRLCVPLVQYNVPPNMIHQFLIQVKWFCGRNVVDMKQSALATTKFDIALIVCATLMTTMFRHPQCFHKGVTHEH